ncbi:Shikimate kinase 2 [Candidatus Annandia adelgestsuga]|uniref:Shikimate kinase 1 n=1 Tax=Candidatus Annandia adelgestsuga TaxID=1302411 RepID=A0A3S9J811_9ENTR|nr:shikimate kinase [Candidatus Annandia adelgestsuga]AZP36389.1 Shikimate kinase 2 [Candidatus Annandia adelgestsuga]
MNPIILYLIGMKGTGKSTICKKLSNKINYFYLDIDECIIKLYRKNISEIIKNNNWKKFRYYENFVLKIINNIKNIIVSTGGGIILLNKNNYYMNNNGKIIYLYANSKLILKRLKNDKNLKQRPKLTKKPFKEEIIEILKKRKNKYDKISNYKISSNLSIIKILKNICSYILHNLIK